MSEQLTTSNIDSDLVHQNLEHLKMAGELGGMFADLYEAAIQEEPLLKNIVVITSGSESQRVLAGTGGFAKHKGESPSGQHEVTVNTEDGIAHFEKLREKRKRSADICANKLGIDPEAFDAKKLAAFIFLHELGHNVDFIHNAPDLETYRARRDKDMASLPIPNLNPVQLERLLAREDGRKWFFDHAQVLNKKFGVSSFHGLIQLQETAYHNIETEDIPDQFAVKIMQKVDTL